MNDDPLEAALDRARPEGAPVDPTGDRMLARLRASMFGLTSEPTRIGRFTILETVGAGGMGSVYAAHDPVLDRRVAIKLLRSPGGRGHDRVLREARALARLAHPNIVAVHDTGAIDELVYIAMELVDGENLRGWAGGRGWRDVVRAFVDAARGLAFAHAAGVVHGDVKPDNLMIGRDGRVRVVDFGLARTAAPAPVGGGSSFGGGGGSSFGGGGGGGGGGALRPSAIGSPSVRGGTPAYLAPEMFDGAPPSERADQFGFCVGLYEALYGERPFDHAGVSLRPAPPASRVPARVRRILVRGLAQDPDARFASMAALADVLDLQLRGRRGRWLAIGALCAAAAGAGVWIASGSASAPAAAAAVTPVADTPAAAAVTPAADAASAAVTPAADAASADVQRVLDQMLAITAPQALAAWPPAAQVLADAGLPPGADPAIAAEVAAQVDGSRTVYTLHLGRARFALAKALWQAGGADQARAVAGDARAIFAEAGATGADDLAAVDGWLAERR